MIVATSEPTNSDPLLTPEAFIIPENDIFAVEFGKPYDMY